MQDRVGELAVLGPHMANRTGFDQHTVIFFPLDPTFEAYRIRLSY